MKWGSGTVAPSWRSVSCGISSRESPEPGGDLVLIVGTSDTQPRTVDPWRIAPTAKSAAHWTVTMAGVATRDSSGREGLRQTFEPFRRFSLLPDKKTLADRYSSSPKQAEGACFPSPRSGCTCIHYRIEASRWPSGWDVSDPRRWLALRARSLQALDSIQGCLQYRRARRTHRAVAILLPPMP